MSEYKSTNTEFPFTPYVDPFTPGGPPPNMPVLTREHLPAAVAPSMAMEPLLRPSRRVDPDEQALIARQAAERVFDQLDDQADATECGPYCCCERCEIAAYRDGEAYAGEDDRPGLGLSRDQQASVTVTWTPKDSAPTSNLAAAAASVFGYAPQFDPGTDVTAAPIVTSREWNEDTTWEDLATFALEADRRFKRHGVMLDCPHHDPVTGLGEHWFIGGVPGSNDMPVTSLVVWAARHWSCTDRAAGGV